MKNTIEINIKIVIELEERNKCVYRHRRLDTNQIFYIGLGEDERPYDKHSRNKYWKNIVNKTGYIVEILAENLSLFDACELEMFLISLYGRTNNKTGILCNLTDGGEGTKGYKKTMIQINNWRESYKNYTVTDLHRENLSKALSGEGNGMYGKKHNKESRAKQSIKASLWERSEEHMSALLVAANEARSKKLIDTATGIIYPSVRKAAKAFNINHSTLSVWVKGKWPNPTTLKYL